MTAVDGDVVTRQRWGGSLLEEARLHGSPQLLTVAPHTQPAAEIGDVETLTAERRRLAEGARARRGVEQRRLPARGEGRGRRRPRRRLVGGASRSSRSSPACSAAPSAARASSRALAGGPHTDQVGQTGTKISADLYVACGISGATQHIAGAKGAKRILAINTDPEAPILAVADYAVIGDLHEVVPAISAELRKVQRIGAIGLVALVIVCGGIFARRAWFLTGLVRNAKPERPPRADVRSARATRSRSCSARRKLLQRLVPGLMHAFIFWGFLVLFPTIVLA